MAAPKLGANKRAGTHPCDKSRGAEADRTKTTAKTKKHGELLGKNELMRIRNHLDSCSFESGVTVRKMSNKT